MDLVVFYSLGDKPSVTYYINNESAGYKIEFPFSHIKNILATYGSRLRRLDLGVSPLFPEAHKVLDFDPSNLQCLMIAYDHDVWRP